MTSGGVGRPPSVSGVVGRTSSMGSDFTGAELLNSGGGENTVEGLAGRATSTSTSGEEAARISSDGSKVFRQWKASLEGEEGVNGVGGGWSMGSVLKSAELS